MDKMCEQCGHLLAPHVAIATGTSPLNGGIILCPVRTEDGAPCPCFCVWEFPPPHGLPESVWVPDEHQLQALRKMIVGD